MVNEDKNLGDAVVDLETEQGQISDEIERDTARGLWNKPDPNDTENEDE